MSTMQIKMRPTQYMSKLLYKKYKMTLNNINRSIIKYLFITKMDQITKIDRNIVKLQDLYTKMSDPNVPLQTHMSLYDKYTSLEKEVRDSVQDFQERFQETIKTIEQQWSTAVKTLESELDPTQKLTPESSLSNISWLLPESSELNPNLDKSSNPLQEMEEILSTLQLLEVDSGSLPESINKISMVLAKYLEVIETVKKLKSEK